MPSTNVFNELCVKISLLRSISEKNITVCDAVYFRLCIDLMHILPPVTAEGFDGSHHPRFAEWFGGSNASKDSIKTDIPANKSLEKKNDRHFCDEKISFSCIEDILAWQE